MKDPLLTEHNITALNETFDFSVYSRIETYNHLIKLNNWSVKEIYGRFEGLEPYRNKRKFIKTLTDLVENYLENKN